MRLGDVLAADGVSLDVPAGSVKRVLQLAAEQVALTSGLGPRLLMDGLIERERLGSTSLGGGVAIPHARYEALEKNYAVFMKTAEPVEVNAADGKPADLFFCLLAPDNKDTSHARLLSRVMRLLGNEITREKIRQSDNVQEIFHLLTADDMQEGTSA